MNRKGKPHSNKGLRFNLLKVTTLWSIYAHLSYTILFIRSYTERKSKKNPLYGSFELPSLVILSTVFSYLDIVCIFHDILEVYDLQ